MLDALRAKSEAAGAHLIRGALEMNEPLGINELLGVRATVKKRECCEGLHGVGPS